jgi:hypothetical protein
MHTCVMYLTICVMLYLGERLAVPRDECQDRRLRRGGLPEVLQEHLVQDRDGRVGPRENWIG